MSKNTTPVLNRFDYSSAVDELQGWCTECQDFTVEGGVDSDGRNYPCPECQQNTVLGAEEACMQGHFIFSTEEGG